MRPYCLLPLALALNACATVSTYSHINRPFLELYEGTRLNIATLSEDQATLDCHAQNGVQPSTYPWLDLPLSLVADTVMLPVTLVPWYYGAGSDARDC